MYDFMKLTYKYMYKKGVNSPGWRQESEIKLVISRWSMNNYVTLI